MSDAIIRKLTHTPLRDLVRGRITGRTDVMRHIDETTDLPAESRDLIKRVVRRSRLWSLEKVDVADELIAHFRDGMEAGESPGDLIASFGGERQAALLIRRAKKRSRPLAWHVLRCVGWLLAALLVFYIGLALVFFAGSPSPSVDYVVVLNEPVLATPEDERAWPLYRQAILDLGFTRRSDEEQREWHDTVNPRPGEERWLELAELLNASQSAIEMIRAAAEKPVLGFILGADGSADDPELWPESRPASDGPLLTVRLPYVNPVRHLANLLASDARVAVRQGEADRFVSDVEALLGMARQLRGEPFLISDLVAIGIGAVAVDQIEHALVERPELLGDAQLQRLAHRLAGPETALDLIDLSGERMSAYDVIQRVYTEDEAGDGRLTPEGIRFLASLSESFRAETWPEGAVRNALGPAALLLSPGRRELLGGYDRYMDAGAAAFQSPLREGGWEPLMEQELAWREAPASVQDLLLSLLAPSLRSAQESAERLLANRDGLLVGMALELYRREHGAYPESLDALTPALLPSVPTDRITGEPLRYRLIDGRPVVYSVGADRDDDSGRIPVGRGGLPNENAAARWDVEPGDAADGDWIVFGGDVEE